MPKPLKCPCCGESAGHLAFSNLEAHGADGEIVIALVIACPNCSLFLGASVNPAEYVATMLRQIRSSRLNDDALSELSNESSKRP
jgi:hypothetical protein